MKGLPGYLTVTGVTEYSGLVLCFCRCSLIISGTIYSRQGADPSPRKFTLDHNPGDVECQVVDIDAVGYRIVETLGIRDKASFTVSGDCIKDLFGTAAIGIILPGERATCIFFNTARP